MKCPAHDCDVNPGFDSCQDGSREVALSEHMAAAHPAHARQDHCSACGIPLLAIEEGHRLWDQYGDWITRNRADVRPPSKWGPRHDNHSDGTPRRGPEYRMWPTRCAVCDAQRGQ